MTITIPIATWHDLETLLIALEHATDANGNFVVIDYEDEHVCCKCHKHPTVILGEKRDVVFTCYAVTNEQLRGSQFEPSRWEATI